MVPTTVGTVIFMGYARKLSYVWLATLVTLVSQQACVLFYDNGHSHVFHIYEHQKADIF